MLLTEQAIRDEVRRINAEAIQLNEMAKEHKEAAENIERQANSFHAQYEALRTLLRELYRKDFGNTGTFPYAENTGEVPF